MPSTLNSLVWKFSESVLSQLVSLAVSIIIARILGPEAYGIVAMVVIFTTMAQVFVDGGFNSALVQKKDADDIDFSSVFYFSLLFSSFLYALLFITAPAISKFYGSQYSELTPVFRVLGVTMIISAINGVQTAYVQKKMMFKSFFWARLVGTVLSGITGICMAYAGYGVWALVAQQIISSVINTFTLYIITKKSPIIAFSLERMRGLMKFGINVLGSNLLITGYKELRALVIGKLYSASDLALFSRGSHYPNLIVSNINSTLGTVLYPRMSLEQDNLSELKRYLQKSLRISTYLLCPLLFGMAAMAEPFIRILLTEKWIGCVPYLQLMCFINLFQPLSNINNQAIRASGRSGEIFKIEIIKKSIELISLLLVMRISVMAIVVNMLVMSALLNFLFVRPNAKYLAYSFGEQMKDLAPGVLMGAIMMIVIYPITLFPICDMIQIVLQLSIGGALYIGMSILTDNQEYAYIKTIVYRRKNAENE